INRRAQPKLPRQARKALGDLLELLMGNQSDRAWCEGNDAVVHLLEKEAVEVDEVSFDVNCQELPLSICEFFRTRGKSAQKYRTRLRKISLADEFAIVWDFSRSS